MDQKEINSKIGAAWKAHREGNNQTAVDMFLHLVEEAPDHIDVYWGLGLSYRDLGDKVQAVEAFKKVKDLVTIQLESESGQLGRYFMLNRMVDQQLSQLDTASWS